MKWNMDASGQDAFDHVTDWARANIARASSNPDIPCPGMKLWRQYLKTNPEASLLECLEVFEAAMSTHHRRNAYATGLLRALIPASPEFRSRVIATLDEDGAHVALTSQTVLSLSEAEQIELERKAPEALRIGRRLADKKIPRTKQNRPAKNNRSPSSRSHTRK